MIMGNGQNSLGNRTQEEVDERRKVKETEEYFDAQFDKDYDLGNKENLGSIPSLEDEEIWNIELKGLCTDQDLILYSELLVKFAQKLQGIGIQLMPANVKTIDKARDIEKEEHRWVNKV